MLEVHTTPEESAGAAPHDTGGSSPPSPAAQTEIELRPRLLDQVRDSLRRRRYSLRTEKVYVHWVKRFILFHDKRHPRDMGPEEVTLFLTHLARHLDVAASTQNQALSALLYLYQHVLDVKLPWLDEVERAKRPARLPTVLTQEEARLVLSQLDGVRWLMASLMYGAGLRLMECLGLRGERSGLRAWSVDRAQRQGGERPGDDAAAGAGARAESAPGQGQGAARCGSQAGSGSSGVAVRVGAQVPECRPAVGLAVCVPIVGDLYEPVHGPAGAASRASKDHSARGRGGGAKGTAAPTGELPHVSALLCDASPGERHGHQNGAGADGAQGCVDDDDLYARDEYTGHWGQEPAGHQAINCLAPGSGHERPLPGLCACCAVMVCSCVEKRKVEAVRDGRTAAE